MLPKAHLTSHSRVAGSRWVITPFWLSGSWRSFLYSFSVYFCHLFLISSASVRSVPFLSFIEPIFAWNVPLVSPIFLKTSLVFPSLLFSSISLHWSLRKSFLSLLAILWNSAFIWKYLSIKQQRHMPLQQLRQRNWLIFKKIRWQRICLRCRRLGFDPWVRKISRRREWQPTAVFLPEEFHRQRSLLGYIVHGIKKSQTCLRDYTFPFKISEPPDSKLSTCITGDLDWIPGSGRSPREGNG